MRRRTDHDPTRPSIVDGKALPDFVDPLFERIEPGVKGAVVEVEDIAEGEQSEDPMVALDVNQHLFDRMTDERNNTDQDVHRMSPPETTTLRTQNERHRPWIIPALAYL